MGNQTLSSRLANTLQQRSQKRAEEGIEQQDRFMAAALKAMPLSTIIMTIANMIGFAVTLGVIAHMSGLGASVTVPFTSITVATASAIATGAAMGLAATVCIQRYTDAVGFSAKAASMVNVVVILFASLVTSIALGLMLIHSAQEKADKIEKQIAEYRVAYEAAGEETAFADDEYHTVKISVARARDTLSRKRAAEEEAILARRVWWEGIVSQYGIGSEAYNLRTNPDHKDTKGYANRIKDAQTAVTKAEADLEAERTRQTEARSALDIARAREAAANAAYVAEQQKNPPNPLVGAANLYGPAIGIEGGAIIMALVIFLGAVGTFAPVNDFFAASSAPNRARKEARKRAESRQERRQGEREGQGADYSLTASYGAPVAAQVYTPPPTPAQPQPVAAPILSGDDKDMIEDALLDARNGLIPSAGITALKDHFQVGDAKARRIRDALVSNGYAVMQGNTCVLT